MCYLSIPIIAIIIAPIFKSTYFDRQNFAKNKSLRINNSTAKAKEIGVDLKEGKEIASLHSISRARPKEKNYRY